MTEEEEKILAEKFRKAQELEIGQLVEKKNGYSYLSWAYAWRYMKEIYPDFTYEVMRSPEGRLYFADETGYWVEVKITACGITYGETLPVMDSENNSVHGDVDTMMINKTIKRCLAKCCALFGIGLGLYAGEDLPESADEEEAGGTGKTRQKPAEAVREAPAPKKREDIEQVIMPEDGNGETDLELARKIRIVHTGKTYELGQLDSKKSIAFLERHIGDAAVVEAEAQELFGIYINFLVEKFEEEEKKQA